MACNSERIYQFKNGTGNATYTLKVNGPVGAFTASARFSDVDTPPDQYWPASEIVDPAEKREPLEGANGYVVSIEIKCVTTKNQKIKVEASVGTEKYCREIACVKDSFQRVVHFIKRT